MNNYYTKEFAQCVLDKLEELFPNAKCELDYNTPYELLIAVILSAQCTDKRVNLVTPKLFAYCNTPQEMAKKSVDDIIPYIKSCGFFNSKARAIIEASKCIVDSFGGQLPQTLEELEKLRGVGRKTANVVFSEAFHGQAIAVDTHVFRVSNRIGLVDCKNPLQCEKFLNEVIPRDRWSRSHHLLIFLGRYCCKSQKPYCSECGLKEYCKSYKEGIDNANK